MISRQKVLSWKWWGTCRKHLLFKMWDQNWALNPRLMLLGENTGKNMQTLPTSSLTLLIPSCGSDHKPCNKPWCFSEPLVLQTTFSASKWGACCSNESRWSSQGIKWSPFPANYMATHRHGDTYNSCEQVYSQRLSLGVETEQLQKHLSSMDLPGCWGEFENYDFLSLNTQNTSPLRFGKFEVEMFLALRIFYIGGFADLYSKPPDMPCFLLTLLAVRDSAFSAL